MRMLLFLYFQFYTVFLEIPASSRLSYKTGYLCPSMPKERGLPASTSLLALFPLPARGYSIGSSVHRLKFPTIWGYSALNRRITKALIKNI